MRARRRPLILAALVAAVLSSALPAAAAPGDPPKVTILAPKTSAPASVGSGGVFALKFKPNQPGTYSVLARTGTDPFRVLADSDATGTTSGKTTLALDAPVVPGTYDLRVRFTDLTGNQAIATQLRSLIVAGPAQLRITSPTKASPVTVREGGHVAVTFGSGAGAYRVVYRASGTSGFDDFPAASGTTAGGSTTVPVKAPGASGTYDVRVIVTPATGRAVSDTEAGSLRVTAPPVTETERCDPLDAAACLLPFPNDHFTAADARMATDRRINLSTLSTPRNVAGKPIDPTEWNRNDGFSPGSMAMTYVAGLDLHRTWGTHLLAERYRDHITDIGRYLAPNAPIVIIDADTGERHPFWSELDTHIQTTDERRVLIMRPAVNFLEGHRYIVALRDLRRADGTVIPPAAAFKNYRDPLGSLDPAIEARRPAMERMFDTLADAGIARHDLYLAWDFTVASERNLAGRALHIRDDAFAQLGDTNLANGIIEGAAPNITIETVTGGSPTSERRVRGTVTVPNYLDRPQENADVPNPTGEVIDEIPAQAPGSRFFYANPGDQLPSQNPVQPTFEAAFSCTIPVSAFNGTKAHPSLYGHGLLGGMGEADGSSTSDLRRNGFMVCGVDWIGMATEDIVTVATILGDMSQFPALPDRAQQGFLNFLLIGRAMAHPQGFATLDAFRDGGQSLIETGELYYAGNSQGGIMGGALTALSPDFTRAMLGVPGMNYSTLLNRSVDWESDGSIEFDIPAYSEPYYAAYRDPIDRQLGFALIQMLWDRGEANGYAQHMTTDPLANTPAHQVFLQVAFADHQVTNVSAEVEARTIGARIRTPSLAPGQHWEETPHFGLTPVNTYPFAGGSVLVYWYSSERGNTTPPNGNVPSTSGSDPHGDPRKDDAGADQYSHFLLTGELIDVCGGAPCVTTSASRG